MKYASIVFLQGDQAEEVFNILHKKGEKEAYNYLLQWNCGDSPIEENTNVGFTPWGLTDELYEEGNYVMSYNNTIGYIGLTQVIKY